jgi:NAD-dependent dihydropyrimidine dehydrogenase PreA subunit
MPEERVNAYPNATTPSRPVVFTEKCTACNTCVEVCPMDVYLPNPEKGKAPVILHQDECWYCGCCVNSCPTPGAIEFNWPLQQRGYFKEKATGRIFRV